MLGGALTNKSSEMRIQCFESRRPQGGYDDSGDVLIALTGTFMYAELQQTVSDWDRLGIIIYDHSGEV